MALSALIVRIGADLTDLEKGIGKANRHVERFGKKIQPMGRSLARIGTNASAAAASLSRMGGAMPGVAGGAAKVIGALGTASIVLGETTVLSAGLTKAWRLLTVASTAVAASSAPAWLASLATPAGLAIAGVVALTGAVAGLTFAWKKLTEVRREHSPVRAFELIDPRRMKVTEMTGRREHMMEGVTASVSELSGAAVEITLARNAVDAWGDALEGVRPVTDAIVQQWSFARDLIVTALTDTSKLTADATTQLYRMLAALKEVAAVSPALSLSEAGGMIRMPGVPSKGPRHAIDPRSVLGSKMDFTPEKMGGSFFRDLKNAFKPKSSTDSMGTRFGQVIQAGGGGGPVGQIAQAVASFGPLGLILPVVTGFFDALAPVLEPLIPILELLGQAIRVGLAPVIGAVVTAFSFLGEALGWVIRGIGRLIDALPGVSAKGLINTGQAMIDAARAARKNTNATEKATDAVNEFASALSNVPRVLNINALRHMVSGGSVAGPDGGTSRPGGFGGRLPRGGREGTVIHGDVIVNVNGSGDPRETAEAVGREIERIYMRGGSTHFQYALT